MDWKDSHQTDDNVYLKKKGGMGSWNVNGVLEHFAFCTCEWFESFPVRMYLYITCVIF